MTLDLDELERKAKERAQEDEWGESSLRRDWGENIAPPRVVLALIERVRAAETSQACEHGISGPRCPECPDGVTQHWVGVRELQERVRVLDRYKTAALKTMDALTREYEALERAAKAAGVKDA